MEASEVNTSKVASAPEEEGIGGSCPRAPAPVGDQRSQVKKPVPLGKGKVVVIRRKRDGKPVASRLTKLADDRSRSLDKSHNTRRVVIESQQRALSLIMNGFPEAANRLALHQSYSGIVTMDTQGKFGSFQNGRIPGHRVALGLVFQELCQPSTVLPTLT